MSARCSSMRRPWRPRAARAVEPARLTYEGYKLALTDALLGAVFESRADKMPCRGPGVRCARRLRVRRCLRAATYAGAPSQKFGGPTRPANSGCAPGSRASRPEPPPLYLPERYQRPVQQRDDRITYDDDDLFIDSSRDPLGNGTRVMSSITACSAPADGGRQRQRDCGSLRRPSACRSRRR